jgi:hypothetical protein
MSIAIYNTERKYHTLSMHYILTGLWVKTVLHGSNRVVEMISRFTEDLTRHTNIELPATCQAFPPSMHSICGAPYNSDLLRKCYRWLRDWLHFSISTARHLFWSWTVQRQRTHGFETARRYLSIKAGDLCYIKATHGFDRTA